MPETADELLSNERWMRELDKALSIGALKPLGPGDAICGGYAALMIRRSPMTCGCRTVHVALLGHTAASWSKLLEPCLRHQVA